MWPMPRLLPIEWLPKVKKGQFKRVVCHWTAGANFPSPEDLEAYHVLCDRVGHFHRGNHPITDNLDCSDDDYARHTGGLNTGSVGFAYCGMAGANHRPFAPGPFPIQRVQWNRGLIGMADLMEWFLLPVDRRTLLMHYEADEVYGLPKSPKWDVSVLTFDRGIWADRSPGDELRARVKILLAEEE